MKEIPLDIIKPFLNKQISLDPRKLALLKSILCNPNNVERQKQLMRLIYPELIINKIFGDPFMPYPNQEDFQGEMVIGKLPNGSLFKLPVDSFIKHMLISGSTGEGKTTSEYGFIIQLLRLDKKFLSLGLKRDLRHLIKRIPLLVFKCSEDSNFQWNILNAPSGVSQVDWYTTFIKVFAETQFLREGAEALLLECLTLLRKKSDQVSIFSLYDFIRNQKLTTFRGTNWRASILNRLQALMINFRKMLNTNRSLPLEKLSESYNIEFELDRAGEFKSFFASLIPIYLFKHRLANNLRGNYLKNTIFVDEVNLLASKTMLKSSSFGNIALLDSMKVGREFKIGFAFFTNEPSALSDSIKAQTAIKILMRLSNWQDVEDMGRTMNLTKEQMEYSTNLMPGQAIVKIPGLPPFPVTFPLVDITKDVTDEEIDMNNENLLRGTEYEQIIRFDSEGSFETPENLEEKESNESQVNEITPEEKAFLNDIFNRPFISITERYQSLTIRG